LTLPISKGPFPVVLLFAGSGPIDRDETVFGHKPFLVLADYLTRQGIALLRLDKRGCGRSTGNYDKATSQDFADDVLAGIAYIKSRKEVNSNQIGLIGHSEGGIIAPMVAAKSKDVDFVVLMAGTGVNGEEILYEQSILIQRAVGATSSSCKYQVVSLLSYI
jgi:predicted acyl esterase